MMTDKEKIKAEIERLYNHWKFQSSTQALWKSETYKEILSFINSMPEELVSEDLEKAANGYAWAHDTIGVNRETFSTQDVPVEKMVRIPIGEEIKTAVLFGAKWAVRQLEKNRLAACDKQTPEEAKREMDFTMSIIEKEHRQPTFDDAIKYGMKVQKQQLMKDAVDAFISDDTITKHLRYDPGEFLEAWDKFEVGDRVKLIIVKEEQ